MQAVQFHEVSKRFIVRQHRTMQETVIGWLRRSNPREEFWALRDVSFHLEAGRTLGIVGRNGSGKSTILKLLSRVLEPTSGVVEVQGRVSALLELGAGFHPDLTGRENVFLNAAFLGLPREQMRERFDEIVAFAELERFIDEPVKHYSSGMYMRLGFAVAVHVDPEILVIDEVLAVGDMPFRQKCFAKLSEFKQAGMTIVFVSHDLTSVGRFCDDVLWIDAGQARMYGSADTVINAYLAEAKQRGDLQVAVASGILPQVEDTRQERWGSGDIIIDAATVTDADGTPVIDVAPGTDVHVHVEYTARKPVQAVSIGIGVHRADGVYVAGSHSAAEGHTFSFSEGKGKFSCVVPQIPLHSGGFEVSVGLWPAGDWRTPFDMWKGVARLVVVPTEQVQTGMVAARPVWRVLAGDAEVSVGNSESPAVPWHPVPDHIVMGEKEEEFLADGWQPVENWPPHVRWTTGSASLYLRKEARAQLVGIAMCRPHHTGEPVTGHIVVEGVAIGDFAIATPDFERYLFPFQDMHVGEVQRVEIVVDDPTDTLGEGRSRDQRQLGVAVREVWLE
jgi:lipopolysaccharide transport system ATP-binding protein